MNKKEVFAKAEDFCKVNHVESYPVNIISLCEAQGIKVFEDELPYGVSGFIIIQDEKIFRYDTNRLIVVNSNDAATRRRFTIAHELAHYVLHRDPGQPLYAHRDAGQNGGIETEANTFAGAVLMPEKAVRDAMSYKYRVSPATIYIAQNFLVSEDAARVRLQQLGII